MIFLRIILIILILRSLYFILLYFKDNETDILKNNLNWISLIILIILFILSFIVR